LVTYPSNKYRLITDPEIINYLLKNLVNDIEEKENGLLAEEEKEKIFSLGPLIGKHPRLFLLLSRVDTNKCLIEKLEQKFLRNLDLISTEDEEDFYMEMALVFQYPLALNAENVKRAKTEIKSEKPEELDKFLEVLEETLRSEKWIK